MNPSASPRLSPARHATLDAAARRIAPRAWPPATPAGDLTDAIETRITGMVPHKRADFELVLDLLGHPLSAFVTVGRFTPFARLDGARQDRLLERWSRSPLPPLRTVLQAVRRLVLAIHYSRPEVSRTVGYLGPLSERRPVYPWEGPVPGAATLDAEPVARAPAGAPHKVVDGARDALAWREAHRVPGRVTTGAELAGDVRLTTEVLVIGTGAGGAVAAARLAEAGREVVLLEEGGFWTAADFTEREVDMTERLYAEQGLRATEDLAVTMLQGRAVGGGTTVNWMIMLRTPDWVLDEWARDAGATGLSPAELRPVFELIEREVHARTVPDDAHSPNNRILLDGAAALGWRAGPAVINAAGCVRAGTCGFGCRYDARRGAARTWIPRALAAGARLYCDARADRIELAGAGPRRTKRVTATLLDRAGGPPRGRLTIEAPVVVLAGGAVGTPALLLRSGLGGGGVGRWLRLHPTTAVVGRHDREVYAAAGIPLSTMCDHFLRGDDGYGFWIECPPFHPSLAAVACPGFGEGHHRVLDDFPRLAAMIALARDGADRLRSSGAVTVDRSGRTRIRYRLAPRDARTLTAAIEAAARLQLAAGAREVLTLHRDPVRLTSERDLATLRDRPMGPNDISLFSAHVNGTCRMGTDPASSGADPDGTRHGVPGLYICDGSLLPTAPGVNPQETIMALASVVAGRIRP